MDSASWLILAGLGGSVLLGGSLQRITGVGFALVASPFLVAVLGPLNGVLVVNLFGSLTSLSVFIRVFRRVEYKRVALMLVPALIATVPGAWVALHMRADVLSVIIGALIIIALVGSFFAQRGTLFSGKAGAIAAGAVSGFMNVTAGVGGPAVSAYAIASRWPQEAFAASIQLYFFVLGSASLAMKGTLPVLDGPQWVACGVALAVGMGLGEVLSSRVPSIRSRQLVILLAFTGAALILVKGIVEWASS